MTTSKLSLLFLIFLISEMGVVAQDNTHFTFSAYGELYYSYDFKNQYLATKPDYIYNHKRLNEVNANLLLAKVNYTDKATRANLGLMAGNYAQYNLSGEPTWVQFVYEANAGVNLGKSTWIDVGILPSHIGFESAIGADCWTLTRSILAENSPYYEAGIKVSSTNTKQTLSGSLLLLNGWQRVVRLTGAKLPAFGTQITYTPSSHLLINYSTYLGDENPATKYGFRTFQNFYFIFTPEKKLNFILGIDIGTQQLENNQLAVWYSPVLISRLTWNKKNKTALRLENYNDKKGVFVLIDKGEGSIISGMSVNHDYLINSKFQCRFEAKNYWNTSSQDTKISSFALTTCLIFRL